MILSPRAPSLLSLPLEQVEVEWGTLSGENNEKKRDVC